jgi:hypothetical protein
MKQIARRISMAAALCACALSLHAADPASNVKVAMDHNEGDDASASFKFEHVPSPQINDAAARLRFEVVNGTLDSNGGGVGKLTDGKVPSGEDAPGENLFFVAGSYGGRLLLDLGKVVGVKQINTYSWHPGSRGPQIYTVYGTDGADANFEVKPKQTDLTQRGWMLIARVNTTSQFGQSGGQYGVSISKADEAVGKFRYLLFDCATTEDDDAFGNTFYSEIDVVDANASEAPQIVAQAKSAGRTFDSDGGKYQITIDPANATDLSDWAFETLAPVVQEWYPKLVAALPSDGFVPPKRVTIRIEDELRNGTPAWTIGSRVELNAKWFRNNLKGEAVGAVIHELVHVVQRQYWRARRKPGAEPMPGWLVEGIPDYLRFFKFEPESHGADDIWLKRQRFSSLRYDKSYRISANFLNWVCEKYDPEIVVKLNAAGRLGEYKPDLWKISTQKSVEELGAEWLEVKREQFGIKPVSDAAAATAPEAGARKM